MTDLSERDPRVARALADPTRLTIYRRIAAASAPVDIATLTEAAGVHHTAVRQHLAKLREAGLVLEEPLPPSGRGRPRLAYRLAPAFAVDRYQQLSTLLAEAVRTGATAREVGQRAGRRAAKGRAKHDAIGVVVEEAARLGFEPQPVESERRTDVVLRACPFAAVAADDPATVCQLHLGLAEGIADELGGISVRRLRIADPHTGGCRLELEREPVSLRSKRGPKGRVDP